MNTRMKMILKAAALIAAASTLGSQAADQKDPSQGEDQRITNEVMNKLSNDPRLSGKVGVETDRGQVTLTGLVTTSGEADRAERDAESVDGVTAVSNQVNALVGKDF